MIDKFVFKIISKYGPGCACIKLESPCQANTALPYMKRYHASWCCICINYLCYFLLSVKTRKKIMYKPHHTQRQCLTIPQASSHTSPVYPCVSMAFKHILCFSAGTVSRHRTHIRLHRLCWPKTHVYVMPCHKEMQKILSYPPISIQFSVFALHFFLVIYFIQKDNS